MMQKSMITYITLAAPLLPGADAVQCCRWLCCGARTSPEDQIPAELLIWEETAQKINAGNATPKRFTAKVVKDDASGLGYSGWPFPKYNIEFSNADGNKEVIEEKKMSAKELRDLFAKCHDFELPKRSRCFPGATARRRVRFLENEWLKDKVFFGAGDEESIRQFSVKPTGEVEVPRLSTKFVPESKRGHPSYEIEFFNETTSKKAWLNSTQILNLFPGCKMEGTAHGTRIRHLREWSEDKQFYAVADNDAGDFDWVDALFNEANTTTPQGG